MSGRNVTSLSFTSSMFLNAVCEKPIDCRTGSFVQHPWSTPLDFQWSGIFSPQLRTGDFSETAMNLRIMKKTGMISFGISSSTTCPEVLHGQAGVQWRCRAWNQCGALELERFLVAWVLSQQIRLTAVSDVPEPVKVFHSPPTWIWSFWNRAEIWSIHIANESFYYL